MKPDPKPKTYTTREQVQWAHSVPTDPAGHVAGWTCRKASSLIVLAGLGALQSPLLLPTSAQPPRIPSFTERPRTPPLERLPARRDLPVGRCGGSSGRRIRRHVGGSAGVARQIFPPIRLRPLWSAGVFGIDRFGSFSCLQRPTLRQSTSGKCGLSLASARTPRGRVCLRGRAHADYRSRHRSAPRRRVAPSRLPARDRATHPCCEQSARRAGVEAGSGAGASVISLGDVACIAEW